MENDNLLIDFDTMLCADSPHDTLSWFMGFKSACSLFGVWKNGDQYLGTEKITMRQIRRQIEEFTRQQL